MLKGKSLQLHPAVAKQQQKLQQDPESRSPQQLARSLTATLLKDFLAVQPPEIYGAATSSDLTGIVNFLTGQGEGRGSKGWFIYPTLRRIQPKIRFRVD
jgi:hypothetical protein